VRGFLVAWIAASFACRPPAADPTVISAEKAGNDTLRGIFVLEGSDPYPIAVMRTAGGRVVIDGATPGMLKLSQLDLWARGTRTSANRFRVSDFRVRGANGVTAWDGIVRTGPLGLRLVLDDGSTHDIRGAPSNFAQLTGSRVWFTEGPDGLLREYGVF
jgi:hypothetical protein